ncbi:MAG: aminotransferase class I/II-fold pyridoxal phosphate-dependent enzyme, partial [Verrucomicrobiota bacterium]
MAEAVHRLASADALQARLKAALQQRRTDGLERVVKVRSESNGTFDLASNDYLRLAQHPDVKAAAITATERWGCSSSASPLINGFTEAHAELLESLKDWCGFAHGMLWNTGYAANQAVLSQLPQRGDVVLADRLIHNSMVNGMLASGARLIRYRHLDLEHLASLLDEHQERTVFVVTESVFSMDGDYPDLATMAQLKEQHGFVWIVDEAHALGWYGERGSGLCEHYGISEQV